MHSVFEWLGMTKEEFFKKLQFGKCIKCGKPAMDFATLCHGHHSAFHKWQGKRTERMKMPKTLYDVVLKELDKQLKYYGEDVDSEIVASEIVKKVEKFQEKSKMPNTDERRAKIIVETEVETISSIHILFGAQANFNDIWQEFLRTDYRKGGNPKPYAIAVAFSIWLKEKVKNELVKQ